MRNVIFAINIPLDGCSDRTKIIPRLRKYFNISPASVQEVDLQVFGRRDLSHLNRTLFWPEVAKDQSASEAGPANPLEPLIPSTNWSFRDP